MRAMCIPKFRHRALGVISRLAIGAVASAIVCSFWLPRGAYADATKTQYELRERCGKQVDTYFRREWGEGIKNTRDLLMTADFTDHYNEKLNKCFFVLTVNSASRKPASTRGVTTSMDLFEINEHKEYGMFFAPEGAPPMECWVLDANGKQQSCRSQDAWKLMIRSYMEH